MRLLLILALLFPVAASAGDYTADLVARKRAEAEQNRMQVMQQIQHRQSNPEAYMASRNSVANATGASYTLDLSSNGHYFVPAHINGNQISFIADTGATDIFLTQNDARSAGIDISNLNYNLTYRTANGLIKAGETKVSNFSVGPITLNDVTVSVSQNPDGVSLLGMSFFNKLSSYKVEGGKMTLYQ